MIIAIDGKSATGKSTTAEKISDILGWICIKTGDIYRQLAYVMSEKYSGLIEEEQIIPFLSYSIVNNNIQVNSYNGDAVIHNEHYARLATKIASSDKIKALINNSIKDYIGNTNVVIEGRNVATNMFPDATVKAFLYADLDTRVQRRNKQLSNDKDIDNVSIMKSLSFRDDAIENNKTNYDISIDTSQYEIEEVVAKILRIYYFRTHKRSLKEVRHFLYSSYQRDTAHYSCTEDWERSNPTRGHCAVVAMIINNYFGGEIKKGYYKEKNEWHYWNVINNVPYDFTIEQYRKGNIILENIQNSSFEQLYENSNTRERYTLLKERTEFAEKQFWSINDSILVCKKCTDVHPFMFETISFGKRCEILIVGEAPAKNGWRITGKAWKNDKGDLVPTGKVLNRLLNGIGLDIDEISYTEAIKCYPEKGKIKKDNIYNCKNYLFLQIKLLRPQIIISMGKHSTDILLGKGGGFSERVGNTYSIDIFGISHKVIPIYHTSPASPLSYKGNVEAFNRIKKELLFLS